MLSTDVLGVPVDGLFQGLGLPPVDWVPVSASAPPSPAYSQIIGGNPSGSVYIPVPDYLQPSGTMTVSNPWTGPVSFTGFQVDDAEANQVSGPGQSTGAGTTSPSASGSQPAAPTAVQLSINPIQFDWLGAEVQIGQVNLVLTFQAGSGSSYVSGPLASSTTSAVTGVLGQVATTTGDVAQDIVREGDAVLLSPTMGAALQGLGIADLPAGTEQLASLQMGQLDVDGQSIGLTIAGGTTVAVDAVTGADQMLGNLMVDLDSLGGSLEKILAGELPEIEGELRTAFEILLDGFLHGFPLYLNLDGLLSGLDGLSPLFDGLFARASAGDPMSGGAGTVASPTLAVAPGNFFSHGYLWNYLAYFGSFASGAGGGGGRPLGPTDDAQPASPEVSPGPHGDDPLPGVLPEVLPAVLPEVGAPESGGPAATQADGPAATPASGPEGPLAVIGRPTGAVLLLQASRTIPLPGIEPLSGSSPGMDPASGPVIDPDPSGVDAALGLTVPPLLFGWRRRASEEEAEATG